MTNTIAHAILELKDEILAHTPEGVANPPFRERVLENVRGQWINQFDLNNIFRHYSWAGGDPVNYFVHDLKVMGNNIVAGNLSGLKVGLKRLCSLHSYARDASELYLSELHMYHIRSVELLQSNRKMYWYMSDPEIAREINNLCNYRIEAEKLVAGAKRFVTFARHCIKIQSPVTLRYMDITPESAEEQVALFFDA